MTPLLLHVFPTFAVGGAQVRFTTLANRFGRSWRHAIVSLDGVIDCASRLSPDLDVTFPGVSNRKGNLFSNVCAIRSLLRTLAPDVLVTSNWGSIEWAIANGPPFGPGLPHIHTEDGFGPEERTAQLPRRVLIRRLALRRSRVVLPSSTLLHIAMRVWRLNPARLHFIPNGVDSKRFIPAVYTAQPTEQAAWLEQGPVIGTVAALRAEKNLARLLRAFHLANQPGKLVIVGDGAERTALQALTVALGLNDRVQFIGYVAEPAALYLGFDIFALSSDTEQMPLSVLEAMAAGVPVAATNVGDIHAMVAEDNTAFITALSDEALAIALRRLLSDAELRRRVGKANRAKAMKNFQQETMFQAYAALINESTLEAGRVSR